MVALRNTGRQADHRRPDRDRRLERRRAQRVRATTSRDSSTTSPTFRCCRRARWSTGSTTRSCPRARSVSVAARVGAGRSPARRAAEDRDRRGDADRRPRQRLGGQRHGPQRQLRRPACTSSCSPPRRRGGRIVAAGRGHRRAPAGGQERPLPRLLHRQPPRRAGSRSPPPRPTSPFTLGSHVHTSRPHPTRASSARARPARRAPRALASDQRYCLNCGQRLSEPRVDFRRALGAGAGRRRRRRGRPGPRRRARPARRPDRPRWRGDDRSGARRRDRHRAGQRHPRPPPASRRWSRWRRRRRGRTGGTAATARRARPAPTHGVGHRGLAGGRLGLDGRAVLAGEHRHHRRRGRGQERRQRQGGDRRRRAQRRPSTAAPRPGSTSSTRAASPPQVAGQGGPAQARPEVPRRAGAARDPEALGLGRGVRTAYRRQRGRLAGGGRTQPHGNAYEKASSKLPSTVGTGGSAPPTDNKKAGGGTSGSCIGC